MESKKSKEFTQQDEKLVDYLVEKFLEECSQQEYSDEKIGPLVKYFAIKILLTLCENELREKKLVAHFVEIVPDKIIN